MLILFHKTIVLLCACILAGVAHAQYVLAMPVSTLTPKDAAEMVLEWKPIPERARVGEKLSVGLMVKNNTAAVQSLQSISTSGQLQLISNTCSSISPGQGCEIQWESLAYLPGPTQATVKIRVSSRIGEHTKIVAIYRQNE
jgi:hypothetical protein